MSTSISDSPAGGAANAPVTAAFKLTLEDLIAARLAFHRLRYRTPRRLALKGMVVIIGLVLGLVFHQWTTGGLMMATGIWLFWFDRMFIPLIARWSYKRDPMFLYETRFSISSDGLRLSNALAESAIQWKFFTDCYEYPRFYLLMGPNRQMVILPMRSVAATDLSRLVDILTAAGLRPSMK